MTMVQLPPGSMRSKPPVIQKEFSGVDKRDSLSIPASSASDMKNLTSSAYPALTTRPGYTQIGATLGAKIIGLGVYKDTELHAIADNGNWYRYTAGAWAVIKSGVSTTATAYFTNFMGAFSDFNLIMSNGTNPVMKWDGVSVTNLANAPSGGNYVTTFQNRVWLAKGREILASALDNAEDWTIVALNDSKAFGKEIESPIGENINGLFGDLAKMTISFPNSIRKLQGGVPSDFNDQNVSQSLGIVNNKSAVTVDGFMHLFHKNGFFTFGGGISPDKSYSEAVQYYADNSNDTGRVQSAAGTDGSNVYFSIPMDSTTAPDTILQYDPRNGVRAWNVWKDIQALHFARMGGELYVGDATGRVLKLGGTSDNGTPITSEWISKWFTAPSMSQMIRFLRMWLTVDLPTGSTITVYLNKSEDEPWEQVGSITASTDIQRKTIYVASNKVMNAKQLRYKIVASGPYTLHEIAFEPDYLPLR